MISKRLNGLYVITDDTLTPSKTILQQVRSALEGGAKIVQLRNKADSLGEIKRISLALESLCQEYNALFVLNDKVELAIELGLSGLHIGKSDHHRVSEIREKFSGYLGVSCYGNLELAQEMQNKGVDYVAFGSFFSSPTKPDSGIVDLDILTQAKEQLDIPVCAIGGLNSKNIAHVMKHKPDMIALISDIWKGNDVEQEARYFASLYKE